MRKFRGQEEERHKNHCRQIGDQENDQGGFSPSVAVVLPIPSDHDQAADECGHRPVGLHLGLACRESEEKNHGPEESPKESKARIGQSARGSPETEHSEHGRDQNDQKGRIVGEVLKSD